MTALLKSVSDIVEDARADERKKVLATREEEIKQAVKMANKLERQVVIKEIESWLDENVQPLDLVEDELRAKLVEMKEGRKL